MTTGENINLLQPSTIIRSRTRATDRQVRLNQCSGTDELVCLFSYPVAGWWEWTRQITVPQNWGRVCPVRARRETMSHRTHCHTPGQADGYASKYPWTLWRKRLGQRLSVKPRVTKVCDTGSALFIPLRCVVRISMSCQSVGRASQPFLHSSILLSEMDFPHASANPNPPCSDSEF